MQKGVTFVLSRSPNIAIIDNCYNIVNLDVHEQCSPRELIFSISAKVDLSSRLDHLTGNDDDDGRY